MVNDAVNQAEPPKDANEGLDRSDYEEERRILLNRCARCLSTRIGMICCALPNLTPTSQCRTKSVTSGSENGSSQ